LLQKLAHGSLSFEGVYMYMYSIQCLEVIIRLHHIPMVKTIVFVIIRLHHYHGEDYCFCH